MVDYFSRYPEVTQLRTTTSPVVINALKSVFARHGIPEILRSDNGPQFSSSEFANFADDYQFCHITSSPHFPFSNGQAERAVKTVKDLLRKAGDPHLALLSYRSTPLPWCGRSPSELLMGRNIRTNLPQTADNLVPMWPYLEQFRKDNGVFKNKQKINYDRHHQVRDLKQILENTDVWITTDKQPTSGHMVSSSDTPQSYIVQTPTGELRKNCSHLNIWPEDTGTATSNNTRLPPALPKSPAAQF